MPKAKFRDVYGKTQGRFVVSEGIAPSEYIFPHEDLPTLYRDYEDTRFEIVIPMGTILQLFPVVGGDDVDEAYFVPANGTAGNKVYNWDAYSLTVEPGYPVGVAQYDLYRPFEYGTSQGVGWLTHALVEYPMVDSLNDDLKAGDLIRPDAIGRPVKYNSASDRAHTMCGQVIYIEKFATNFDDGLLSYMEIPSDKFNTALEEVYTITKSGDYQGTMGIRANLDVTNCLGAIRILLKF